MGSATTTSAYCTCIYSSVSVFLFFLYRFEIKKTTYSQTFIIIMGRVSKTGFPDRIWTSWSTNLFPTAFWKQQNSFRQLLTISRIDILWRDVVYIHDKLLWQSKTLLLNLTYSLHVVALCISWWSIPGFGVQLPIGIRRSPFFRHRFCLHQVRSSFRSCQVPSHRCRLYLDIDIKIEYFVVFSSNHDRRMLKVKSLGGRRFFPPIFQMLEFFSHPLYLY